MKIWVILLILLVLPICFAKEVNIVETFESDKNTGETTYYYAGSKLIATKNNDVINYEYQDRLGSDVESNSLPFGEEINSGERFSFTGKELDSELYYFNARYYDSKIGRFTSVDPVEGNNPYAYVENNPMTFVDPSGMVPEIDSRFLTYNGPYAAREDWRAPMVQTEGQNIPPYSGYVSNIPTEIGSVVTYAENAKSTKFGIFSIKRNRLIIAGIFTPWCVEYQCADVAIHVWAEYQMETTGDAVLPTNKGNIRYSEWGDLSKEVGYNDDWKSYLRYIFVYSSTSTLKNSDMLTKIGIGELMPGDLMFTKENGDAHVVTIKDIKFDENGRRRYTVFDGGTPVRTVKVYTLSESKLRESVREHFAEFRRWLMPNSDQ